MRRPSRPRTSASCPPGPTGFLPAIAVGTFQPLVAVGSASASIVPTAPAPTSGGFVPSTINLLPALLTPAPTPTASPTPTPSPLLRTIEPIIVSATPAPSPTPTPLLKTLDPIIVPTATPTPTPAPTTSTSSPTPTPAPTQAPLICLPLVGCF